MSTPFLWAVPVVVLLLIWFFAIPSFFKPNNLAHSVDTDSKVTASVAQLASMDEKEKNRHRSTNGARDYSWSERSESQVIRAGSTAGSESSERGTVARQAGWRLVSGSSEVESVDTQAPEITGESSDESESQATDPYQSGVAGEDTARSDSNSDSAPNDSEQDNWDGDPSDEDYPGGDFTITGQIVNKDAEPVSGLAVVAVAHRLFDEDAARDLADSVLEQRTVTDWEGYFQFQGLADGEYGIKTIASGLYPEVASTVTRTGVDSLRLVVVEQREVWISGVVESTSGGPLAGAEIVPITQSERIAVTNHNGDYSLRITMKGSSDYPIRFWAEGHREQTVRVSAKEAQGVDGDGITRDVALEPNRALTVVAGTVTSMDSAVVGERVYLKSSQTGSKYSAVTDQAGAFAMGDVEVGSDYILWISPQGPYRLYRKNNVEIPADNGMVRPAS